MYGQQPTRQPAMQLTIRRIIGLEPVPRGRIIRGDQAEVKVELDATLEQLERVFEESESPDDPIVLLDAGKVVAHVTLSALATQVLRLGPPAGTRQFLLGWGERTGVYWCPNGLHWSMTSPCPEHGS